MDGVQTHGIPSLWAQIGGTHKHVVFGYFAVLGLWGPLAHCMVDLDHRAGGTLLVDQGGDGPMRGGPCLGHHLFDLCSRDVNLRKTW